MTFEEFQKSKRPVIDLRESAEGFEADNVSPGLVYAEGYYIERNMNTDPQYSTEKWCLTLCNESFASDDLEELERRLYDFAVSDGGL